VLVLKGIIGVNVVSCDANMMFAGELWFIPARIGSL